MMEHSIARDLLEGYVDGTLEPETREAVEAHLEECAECRALIEGVEPIRFPTGVDAAPEAWSDDRFRKMVRRSLARVALNLFSWIVIGVLVIWLFTSFVVQPLVIDRGDRATSAVIATWDLAVMLQPGTEASEWVSNPGLLSRTTEITTVMAVGSEARDLGTVVSKLGLSGLSGEYGGPIFVHPELHERVSGALDNLPSGTVTTVEFVWDHVIDIADVSAMIEEHPDVSVTWVGFPTGPGYSGMSGAGFGHDGDPGFVGYGTCSNGPPDGMIVRGSASGGGSASPSFSRSYVAGGPSVAGALEQVRRAMDNLLSRPEFREAIEDQPSAAALEEARDYLDGNDPGVVAMVVTGPTELVRQFVSDADEGSTVVLGVDFWNWNGPLCGGR